MNNEPISARPPTAGYRLRKSWKRNKLLYIALFSITAALMIGLASSLFQQARIKRTARTLRESLYASEMNTAFSAWREGRVSQARALLDKQRPTNAESDLRSFDWRYLWQVTRPTEAFTLPGATYWGVAISPDGKITASVGQNELALWSVENQKKILTLGTNYSWNHSLAFSPDGKMLAAPNGNGGANFVVDLWDVPNQRRLHQLVFPQQVLGVTFSPDGNTLITTAGRVYERDTPGEVRLWDPHSGLVRASLKGITSWVCQAAFSPNGDVFATSSGDGVVRVWASATGAKLRDFPAQGGFVFPVTFSRDGRLVAAGTQDGYVWIWDWENGRTESFFKAHEEPIYALRFMKDNQRMVTASRDYTARLWDVNSKQELQRFAGHTRAVNDVAILPDERTIVTSSEDLNLKFWKIRPEAQGQLLTETTEMCGMRFGGSRYLFVIEWQPKSRVTIFDTESRRKLKVMKGQEAGGSASGRRLVVADGSKLILLDPVTLAEVGQVECNTELGGAMSFSPDDRWVALRRRNGFGGPHDAPTKAIIVDLTKLQVVHELDTSDEGFGTVFFASAGKLLITMKFGDKAMRLWETATWSLLPESIPPGPSSDFPNVALSPDGNVVAKGGEQGLVRRWTLSPFAELPKLQLVGGFVLSLAFSGDGKTLAIGTDRGQLTLYNVAAGREVVAFPAHAWYAGGGAAFSPDDRFVASSGYDKKVLLWKAPSWDEITRRETFVLEPTTK